MGKTNNTKQDLQNKHILVLPKWYPNPNYISLGIFTQRHVQSVSPYTNISVLYVQSDHTLTGWTSTSSFEKESGIDTLRYSFAKKITGISFLDKFLKFFFYFFYFFKGFNFLEKEKNKIDLIHVTVLLRTGIFAWMKYFFSGTPYIITEHWTGYLPSSNIYNKSGLKKIITPFILKHARLISPASDNLGEAMQNLGLKNKNYFTVHNVVDTDFFYPDFELKNPTPKILTVAMLLDAHKNISGMMRVSKRLKDEGIDFLHRIIGKGEDRDLFIELSKELGLQNQVEFLGIQSAQVVAEEMRNADFLLLFSNYENLPCVIIEAMASGIPAISTDVGGISEMIRNDKLGTLIPPRDEEALYQTIKSFIRKRNDFDKAFISHFAQHNFGKEFIGQRILEMYHKVLTE